MKKIKLSVTIVAVGGLTVGVGSFINGDVHTGIWATIAGMWAIMYAFKGR